MTDTTDTKALQRPTRKHYDWSKAVWMDCDRCGEAHTGTVLADDGTRICAGCCDSEFYSAWEDLAETAIKLLEAERQHREAAKAKVGVLEGIIARKEFDALKGDQVPYAWVRISQNGTRNYTSFSPRPRKGNGDAIPLFTAPSKPVISKEKLCDWLEDNFDIDDSQRDAFANCFAHHCNCIVKKENE